MNRHVPDDHIPYFCTTCRFKALTEGKWKQHSETMLALTHEVHSCTISKCPYRVTIGDGKDIFKKIEINDRNVIIKDTVKVNQTRAEPESEDHFVLDFEEIKEEIVEVKEDPRDVKLRALERELEEQKSKFEKEIEDLKRASTFEANRFGAFITRLEKRKEELKKENENQRREISNLKTSLKRREQELKRFDDEEPPRKIKSVVAKLNPKENQQPQPRRHLDFGSFHRY